MLRQWAQTAPPQSSAAFESASAEVMAVQNEMKICPSEPQRTRAIAAIDRILVSLSSGKGELTRMAGAMSGYLQQQRAARGSLPTGPQPRPARYNPAPEKSAEKFN
jgi:hypothetical protein